MVEPTSVTIEISREDRALIWTALITSAASLVEASQQRSLHTKAYREGLAQRAARLRALAEKIAPDA